MPILVYLGLLSTLLFRHATATSWSQQYGNAASASYIDYEGHAYPGWTYAVPYPTAYQPDIVSPAVSAEGILFFWLPPQDPDDHSYIIALSPDGKELWKNKPVTIGNNTIKLTNILCVEYGGREMVIFGVNEMEVSRTNFRVFAWFAIDGLAVWESEVMRDFKFGASIAADVSKGTLAVGGLHEAANGSLLVFSLDNGTLLWKSEKLNTGQYGMRNMQIRAIQSGGTHMFLLPTDPYVGSLGGVGRLYAFQSAAPWGKLWESNLFFGDFPYFSVSVPQKIVYGMSIGSQPFGNNGFAASIDNGMVIFHIKLLACGMAGPEGLTVDGEGYVYYSCEAQVFSLYPNGTLRWLSEVFGSCTSGTGGLAVDSVHKSLYFYYCDNRLF